ncbi:MAG: hydantoinase B/oxoprolinase family protein [Thermoleophilia bacterium]
MSIAQPVHKPELDLVKYEVFYNRMKNIMEEGKEVLRYLSGSTIAREAGEVMQAFYLPSGEATAIACGILMHIMNVTRVIGYMASKEYETEGIGVYEGDQFINNDAYIGGMHAPDISLIAPLFYEDTLVGYTASISHTTETGGVEPGGMCPSATEAWHDGIHLPAVKLVEKGQMRRDVMNMIMRSVRTPAAMEVDVKARIAANERVRTRIKELIDDVGLEFFQAASERLLDDAEVETRAKIKALKPGKYRARVYNDTVGVSGDKLATIEVELEIKPEGALSIRVPTVSPQLPSYNNAYLPAVEASAFYVLLVQLLYDVRWNSAIARVVDIDVPERSRLNASADQSVGYATVGIAQVFTNALIECLSRAFYASGLHEETVASSCVVSCGIWGGLDQYGRPCGNILSNLWPASGMGGRFGRDGIDSSVQYFNPWNFTADAEGEEALMPVLHWVVKHRPNSGGFGRWRGGVGVKGIDVAHRSNLVFTYVIGTGGKIQLNQGLFGGYPSACIYADRLMGSDLLQRAEAGEALPYDFAEVREMLNGEYIPGAPSIPAKLCKSGDIIMSSSLGGAGTGDPIEREIADIEADIRDGLATAGVAAKPYAVVFTADGRTIDPVKTEELRGQVRAERMRQGKPCGEYLKDLVERRATGNLSQVAKDFLAETEAFSPSFAQEIQDEVEACGKSWSPIGFKDKVEERLTELTMYVDVGRLANGQTVTSCSKCGFVYGDAQHNFKYYTLVHERKPSEILPGPDSDDRLGPDDDWNIFREFYCPGCGAQIEVESVPPGMPILKNYSL